MDPNFLLIGIGLLLTVAGWSKWRAEPRSASPARAVLFVLGLCAISLALIHYSVFVVYVHRIGGFGDDFAAFRRWARLGFFLSVTALGFGVAGRGRSRILVLAAAFQLTAIWILAVEAE